MGTTYVTKCAMLRHTSIKDKNSYLVIIDPAEQTIHVLLPINLSLGICV